MIYPQIFHFIQREKDCFAYNDKTITMMAITDKRDIVCRIKLVAGKILYATAREDRDRCRTNVLTGRKGPTLYPRAHLQLGWARSMLSDNWVCMCIVHRSTVAYWRTGQVSRDMSNVYTNFTLPSNVEKHYNLR